MNFNKFKTNKKDFPFAGKLLIVFSIIFFTAIVVEGVILINRKEDEKKQDTTTSTVNEASILQLNGLYVDNAEIVKVGEEIIYGVDVNFVAGLLGPVYVQEARDGTSTLSLDHRIKAKERAEKYSALLQEASGKDWIILDSEYYNDLSKNQFKRQEVINSVTNQWEQSRELALSAGICKLTFFNVIPPQMGIENADNQARLFIEDLRDEVNQGGDIETICNNAGESDGIDSPTYRVTESPHTFSEDYNTELNELLISLDVDELSEVFGIYDGGYTNDQYSENDGQYIFAYAFIKMFVKEGDFDVTSFEGYLDKIIKNYQIEDYE